MLFCLNWTCVYTFCFELWTKKFMLTKDKCLFNIYMHTFLLHPVQFVLLIKMIFFIWYTCINPIFFFILLIDLFIFYERNRDLFVSEQNKCNNKMIVFISLIYWMLSNCCLWCCIICTPWSLCPTLVNMSSKYFVAFGC